jgi:hypothetical protein
MGKTYPQKGHPGGFLPTTMPLNCSALSPTLGPTAIPGAMWAWPSTVPVRTGLAISGTPGVGNIRKSIAPAIRRRSGTALP